MITTMNNLVFCKNIDLHVPVYDRIYSDNVVLIHCIELLSILVQNFSPTRVEVSYECLTTGGVFFGLLSTSLDITYIW